MLLYVLKRILLYVPTILVVCIVIFYLSRQNSELIIDQMLENEGMTDQSFGGDDYRREYEAKVKFLHLDYPLFYWQIVPSNYPRNLNTYIWKEDISLARQLAQQSYDSEDISNYMAEINKLKKRIDHDVLPNDWSDLKLVKSRINNLSEADPLENVINALSSNQKSIVLPRLDFFGTKNQFHFWLSNLMKGEFGTSSLDNQRVLLKLQKALPWTLFISVFALFFTILISIPLGVFLSTSKYKYVDHLGSILSYGIYSIPTFWLATILVVFFTNSNYSPYLNIFPSIGVDIKSIGKTNFEYLVSNWTKLILPIFCLTFHSMSYLAMQTKRSMMNQLTMNYIQTLKVTGMKSNWIHWKHALKNAMIPIITVIVASLPSLIAGSVIMEVIFNIPGMGRLIYDSILGSDWNVVYVVVLMIALLSWLSYLIGDILYAFINPKIRFDS